MSLAICIFLEKLSNIENTATCRIPSTKVLSYLTSWSFSNPLSHRLYAIRYFIQDIARFMKPVPLYFHLFPDFPHGILKSEQSGIYPFMTTVLCPS